MSFPFRFPPIVRASFCTLLGVCCWLPLVACLDIDFDASFAESPQINSQSVKPGEVFSTKEADYYTAQAAHWKAEWLEDGKWRDHLNYAVCLALLKEYDEALTHLLEIDAEKPGQYSIAINLATVYEQKKQYKLAIQWMEKAIAIDPEAHAGSEWIHLNILKAEAAGRQRSCTAQQLIEQDFGIDSMPHSTMDDGELGQLAASIFYQLNQRVWFQTKPDPYAARLAFELGNLNLLRSFPTVCLLDYEFAKEKGFKDPLLEKRIGAVTAGAYTPPPPSAEYRYVEKQTQQWLKQGERAAKEAERTAAEEADDEGEDDDPFWTAITILVPWLGGQILIGIIFWVSGRSNTGMKKLDTRNFNDLFDKKHD